MFDHEALVQQSARSAESGSCLPVITIVTICRNAEAVLEPTMVSVLNQEYTAIDYIVVDGLSSDRTVELAHQVAGRYPHREVRIISEADQGISDAMNKGVLAARGAVVAHLHAGDSYIDDTIIAKVMDSYRADRWRWAIASSVVIDDDGRQTHVYSPREDYRRLLRQNFVPHQSTFLARDVFLQHGLFRVDLKQAMDYEFWLRITFKGGERYKILGFRSTYFLAGGRSAQLIELLHHLRSLRQELRSWGQRFNWFDDLIFLSRVLAFGSYSAIRQVIRNAMQRRRDISDDVRPDRLSHATSDPKDPSGR